MTTNRNNAQTPKRRTNGKESGRPAERMSVHIRPWLLGILLSLWVAAVLSPHVSSTGYDYEAGDYIEKTIKAPRSISVEDKTTTKKKRDQAEAEVLPVYDYDRELGNQASLKVSKAFQMMGDFYKGYMPPEPEHPAEAGTEAAKPVEAPTLSVIPKEVLEEKKKEFASMIGIEYKVSELDQLAKAQFTREVEIAINRMVTAVMSGLIVADRELLFKEFPLEATPQGITKRVIQDKSEENVTDLSLIRDLKDVDGLLSEVAKEAVAPELSKFKKIIVKTAGAVIQPNLTFNKSETTERKSKAREGVFPVVLTFEKGQKILGDGEPVTEDILLVLRELNRSQMRSRPVFVFFGIAMASFILIAVVFEFSRKNIRKFQLREKDILFLFFMTGVTLTFTWIARIIAGSLTEKFTIIPLEGLEYAIPVAAATIMVRFVLNSEIAIVFAAVISLFTGILFDWNISYGFFVLVGSIVGAQGVGHANQRNTLIKAGLMVAAINIVSVFAIQGMTFEPGGGSLQKLPFWLLGGALGGLFSGLVVVALTPVIEWLFSYTTDIKLLELGNMNHPLMRELMTHATGTYNHSTLVASLAEVAAESIGANPLLAKVAALYHDVGKANKPHYFIENIRDEENRHDKLFPRMSGLILTAHVKDGVEMARAHNLGDAIVDIIQQHHGTSLIKFFYQRAKEMEDPSMESVSEEDFRYPGPKPQTREAGIVMLADVVEATSRVLKDPTPARISALVDESIDNIFREGQLDECELSLKDLNAIGEAFTRLLTGIFHQRIEYPEGSVEILERQKKGDNGRDKKQPGPDKDIGAPGQAAGIRRS